VDDGVVGIDDSTLWCTVIGGADPLWRPPDGAGTGLGTAGEIVIENSRATSAEATNRPTTAVGVAGRTLGGSCFAIGGLAGTGSLSDRAVGVGAAHCG
jgi:hypothetical protein